jgi:porin
MPPESRGTLRKRGYYYAAFTFQQFLAADPDKPGQGWGLFADLGLSEGNPNVFEWHAVVGIGGVGVLGRDLDRWGVGYFRYALSKDLKDGLAKLGVKRDDEQGVEAYYNIALTPWLRVTANLQWIKPTDPDRKDAAFAGLRTQVKF